jgi:hypothetical protein
MYSIGGFPSRKLTKNLADYPLADLKICWYSHLVIFKSFTVAEEWGSESKS